MYWTLSTLASEMKPANITIESQRYDLKYNVTSNSTLKLLRLGGLLGFPGSTAIHANTNAYSPSRMEINRGVGYFEVSCDIVDRSSVLDSHGSGTVLFLLYQ